MDRVGQFEEAMGAVDVPGPVGADIAVVAGAGVDMTVDDLTIRLGNGEPIAAMNKLAAVPGERLLVRGPSGAGKSALFRALAGIWPLGQGTVRLPYRARVLALPQRPYFPLGTLRQALTYPTPAAEVDDVEVRNAMAATGLSHLADRLDEEAEWNTMLSGGEQQRVGFARALIDRPTVLLLDEAVSTLEDAEARDLYHLLTDMLPECMVISTGRSASLVGLHHRVIEMTAAPLAGRARPPSQLAAMPA